MVKGLELAVAGYIEQNVSLRLLSDVWQKGVPRSSVSRDYRTVLLFYGPDVDTSRFEIIEASPPLRGNLTPSISEVVDQQFLDRLPLAGRDVYELIGLQPGAASDLATVRGVGVSVNGQRPSASSFLLNGLENNNYLTTGPLTPLPPEAIEEYRVSTNNFAAEFGRTSGYLSNAVTRRGTSEWHGLGYFYTRQDWLNATDVQQQQEGQAKQPFSEYEAGGRLTGPLAPRAVQLDVVRGTDQPGVVGISAVLHAADVELHRCVEQKHRRMATLKQVSPEHSGRPRPGADGRSQPPQHARSNHRTRAHRLGTGRPQTRWGLGCRDPGDGARFLLVSLSGLRLGAAPKRSGCLGHRHGDP